MHSTNRKREHFIAQLVTKLLSDLFILSSHWPSLYTLLYLEIRPAAFTFADSALTFVVYYYWSFGEPSTYCRRQYQLQLTNYVLWQLISECTLSTLIILCHRRRTQSTNLSFVFRLGWHQDRRPTLYNFCYTLAYTELRLTSMSLHVNHNMIRSRANNQTVTVSSYCLTVIMKVASLFALLARRHHHRRWRASKILSKEASL